MQSTGSLSRHVLAWEQLPASDWTLGVVRSGFRLPWRERKAPLTRVPISFPPPGDPSAWNTLDLEVQSLLSKGAVELVHNQDSPGFYGRLFTVPKASGGWRPVLDLSTLNTYLVHRHFRMETAGSIRDSIRPGDWAISIDLRDAYFHLLIHEADRKFLRFVWKGQVFQFRAVPFGLAPAPWLFTKVTKDLCTVVRRQGIRLRVYLDDWLLLARSASQCQAHSQFVLNLCMRLGFVLNDEKSELIPSQKFLYFGIQFDSVNWTVIPSPQRLFRLQETLLLIMSLREASARVLASLLGMMESLSLLLPLGRLHKRQFQRFFLIEWGRTGKSWSHHIPLDDQFSLAVAQWQDQSWLTQGVPIAPPQAQEILFTDASQVGWGAHMGDLTASGTWPPCLAQAHINLLELEAVWMALKAFVEAAEGKHVLLNTDNTTVAAYVNKQGGAHSFTLSKRVEAMLLWCQDRRILLSAKYVSGKLNILADALSRAHMILPTEWTVVHRVLEPILVAWFKPQIDLFATRFSRRLPLFVSPVPDPQAWAVDALSLPWTNLLGYAFPPFPILGKVIRKASIERATLILVAPKWEGQPWYPDLLDLVHENPIPLRIGLKGLVQPRTGVPHANPAVLNLHAWLVCGNRCGHVAPQRM